MTKKRYALLLAAAWLAVCFAAVCVYAAKCGTYFIDADMSSELVLARQLSHEGGVLSKNWYYSSELRVLNNQLVFAPLFALSDNWQLVRTLGTAITLAVMTACYIFMARGTGLSWTGTLASAGVLLLPLSDSYTYAVLTGLFYIPHICISFMLFGLYCRYTGAGRKKPLWGVLAAVLAFIAGLGGVRQLFIFTVPVVFASFECWRAESRVKLAPAALMAALLVLCSANTYRVSTGYDANSDLKDIVSVVRGEGYTEGYSSFWTGNLITELSSGAVDMRIVGGDMIVEPGDMAYVYEWLQAKAHKDTVPAGRFFLVLFNFESELPIKPAYTNQTYRLYGFDSFDEFEALYK